MEHYNIITNPELLKAFIDWLPDLEENETFYCSLFARKKYSPKLIHSNDKTQLKRFKSTKERLYEKLSQLELPIGRWRIKDRAAPPESLVTYINPNPRSQVRAAKLTAQKCIKLVFDGAKGYDVTAEAMSCLQKAKSRSWVVDFDIDTKDIDLHKLKELNLRHYNVLETRGGYHILVFPKKETDYRKEKNLPLNWHQKIIELFPCDQIGDNMIPIAGCTQGGFTPKFV